MLAARLLKNLAATPLVASPATPPKGKEAITPGSCSPKKLSAAPGFLKKKSNISIAAAVKEPSSAAEASFAFRIASAILGSEAIASYSSWASFSLASLSSES